MERHVVTRVGDTVPPAYKVVAVVHVPEENKVVRVLYHRGSLGPQTEHVLIEEAVGGSRDWRVTREGYPVVQVLALELARRVDR